MADRLETYISKLSRREDVLRGALKCVLDALREQRAYTDSLYDQMYSLAERIERIEDMGDDFRADEGIQLQECARLEEICIQDSRDKQSAMETTENTSALSDSSRAGGSVPVGKAPELPAVDERSVQPVVAVLEEEITDEPTGEQMGHYTIEESIESILEENSKHADERFASIKRNDAQTKKKLRQVLEATRRQSNLAK
jgi:hypothetical protein